MAAKASVTTNPVNANTNKAMVHDLSASTSVNPLILAKIQNPLSFIHDPTREPQPIAAARYTGWNGSDPAVTSPANMEEPVIIATVLDPCAIFSKAATLKPPAQDLRQQQAAFTAFRETFNTQRPHEALAMATPASRYRPSERRYPAGPLTIEYDDAFDVRKVRSNGEIKWQGKLLYVSEALIGEPVGLKEADNGQWELHFSKLHIGTWNRKHNRFETPKV